MMTSPRSGSGRPPLARWNSSLRAAPRSRCRETRRASFPARSRALPSGPATGTGWTAAIAVPIRCRDSSPTARTARRRSSTRRRSGGPTELARHSARRAGALRAARRHLHAGRHLGGRGGAAAGARRPRHHRHRDDAGRRIRRALRLGLRRRQPLRADAALRHAGRSARASSIGPMRLGLGVILDVVYNHLGPDGNYLAEFSTDYFTDRYKNDWGRAINFDGTGGRRARFFVANAGYWIDEFHFDGLRLDATQDINDASPEHMLAGDRPAARARRAGGRSIYRRRRERAAGHPAGATARGRAATGSTRCGTTTSITPPLVALTGRREAYYTDYRGSPQEFISVRQVRLPVPGAVVHVAEASAAARPALDLPPHAFVTFLENHDQVANSRVRPPAASADRRRPLPRADRADAARAGHAACCSRGRSSRPTRRSCTSPIIARSCAADRGRGARSS